MGSPASPSRDGYASKPSSPSLTIRSGRPHSPEASFGFEERFAWQNAKFQSDVLYDLPSQQMTQSAVFGTSIRGDCDNNPDAKKRSGTGPGTYHVDNCYNKISGN